MGVNVRGEPVFNVTAASWFWESGGCKTSGFRKKNRITIGNHYEEDFYPDKL
jgi:hypothetical protein